MSLTELTRQLLSGEHLTEQQAAAAALAILREEASPVQVAAFLTALQMRGETVNELVGFAEVLRNLAEPFQAPPGVVLDTCGTGGDHSGTFNISTAVAFVVAGAGVKVAKHGNRAASSKSGAADVLQALGVKIGLTSAEVSACVAKAGFAFMLAPAHHPAMRHVGPVRTELGTRTIFNILGPLSNPAGVKRLLVGVFARSWLEPIAETLRDLGTECAWVIHGSDGLDEITTTGPTYVAELKNGAIRTFEINPEDAGLPLSDPDALKGGEPGQNAAALIAVVEGAKNAYRDIAIINAAAALVVAGKAETIKTGAEMAAAALDSGKVKAVLADVIAASNAGVA